MSTALPSPHFVSPRTASRTRAVPRLVMAFFVADISIVLVAIASHVIARRYGVEPPNFFKLSQESNLPTWYSGFQHAVVGLLFAILAAREIPRNVLRWPIALPSLMFLFFSFDEIAMVHERLGEWIKHHHGASPGGMTNSAPAMLICLPLAIAGVAYMIWQTRPYWTGRRFIAIKFLIGTAMFLFCAGGLEIVVNLVKDVQVLVSLETLIEESGEMLGTTIVMWSALELLAAEKLAIRFDAKGMHFESAN